MLTLPLVFVLSTLDVAHQHLEVRLDPATSMLEGRSIIDIGEGGILRLELHDSATLQEVLVDGRRVKVAESGEIQGLQKGDRLQMDWTARLEEDVQAGERIGQIHNHSVKAHVGEDGVFLSEGSNWHPQVLDEQGHPLLRSMSIELEPIEGWSLVASGNPIGTTELSQPSWAWKSPRPVDGVAVVGNRHVQIGREVQTESGPVEVVVHLHPDMADYAPLYLDASENYLRQYTPLIGAYPFKRFTVVQNFFSSGFAFPGFTVLGPRVIAMAPRSLKPGYLDHELVHAWWGNGVYVDPDDGNWCEALTSYCTNYGRRALEDGAEEATRYRRGILNKASLDPTLDDGPLGNFGRSGQTVNRFVGYEKGSFVFMMLEDILNDGVAPTDHADRRIWSVLKSLAERHMGSRIGWSEIQAEAEAAFPDRPSGWLDPFFDTWVREHVVPMTTADLEPAVMLELERRMSEDGSEVLIDPEFHHYRLFPHQQTSPTIAGTLGEGVTILVDEGLPVGSDVTGWMAETSRGESLLLVGEGVIEKFADRIARTDDPIITADGSFKVAGRIWDEPGQSVLHTMHDPDHPGRYLTVFHSNGQIGWQRLRLIWYYGKDTTVVWDGGETVLRRVHEPSAWLPIE
ncbi:MAG: hypothetical protein CMJ39_05775 [Phycisphaerae bacterium]|nr:hypothetical protein [Phycisphaerae bacterium]